MDQATAPDFFISYTESDVAWAQRIAVTLEDAGYLTVSQVLDMLPGNDFARAMHRAATTARRTIAVLSPAHRRLDRQRRGHTTGPLRTEVVTEAYFAGNGSPPVRYRIRRVCPGHVGDQTARDQEEERQGRCRRVQEREQPGDQQGQDGLRRHRPRQPAKGPGPRLVPPDQGWSTRKRRRRRSGSVRAASGSAMLPRCSRRRRSPLGTCGRRCPTPRVPYVDRRRRRRRSPRGPG